MWLLMLIDAVMLPYSEGLLYLVAGMMLGTVSMFTKYLVFLIYDLICEVVAKFVFTNYPTCKQAY
jgi:hypothetical protein